MIGVLSLRPTGFRAIQPFEFSNGNLVLELTSRDLLHRDQNLTLWPTGDCPIFVDSLRERPGSIFALDQAQRLNRKMRYSKK